MNPALAARAERSGLFASTARSAATSHIIPNASLWPEPAISMRASGLQARTRRRSAPRPRRLSTCARRPSVAISQRTRNAFIAAIESWVAVTARAASWKSGGYTAGMRRWLMPSQTSSRSGTHLSFVGRCSQW
jgi:hypothetical protein